MNLQGQTRGCRQRGIEPGSPKSQGSILTLHDFPEAVILQFEPWPIWSPENSVQMQELIHITWSGLRGSWYLELLLMSTEMYCNKGIKHGPLTPLTMGENHVLTSEYRVDLTKVLTSREEKKTNLLPGEHFFQLFNEFKCMQQGRTKKKSTKCLFLDYKIPKLESWQLSIKASWAYTCLHQWTCEHKLKVEQGLSKHCQ